MIESYSLRSLQDAHWTFTKKRQLPSQTYASAVANITLHRPQPHGDNQAVGDDATLCMRTTAASGLDSR